MFSNLKKIILSIQIYFKYLDRALRQIYRYYTSPYPLRVFLKQWSLANRALRVFWAAPSPGRPPLDQETIQLILDMIYLLGKIEIASNLKPTQIKFFICDKK